MSALPNSTVNCPGCGAPLVGLPEAVAAKDQCPVCEKQTRVVVFPALTKPVSMGNIAETVMVEGEATCFYHTQKRAVVPCDACGRFLCAVCDLEINGRHLCPQCLEAGTKKGKVESLERGRFRWDQVVATVLLLPLIGCGFFLPLTALIALGLIVWKWKAPASLVSNTRVIFVVCAVVALIEFFGGATFWWFMFNDARRH